MRRAVCPPSMRGRTQATPLSHRLLPLLHTFNMASDRAARSAVAALGLLNVVLLALLFSRSSAPSMSSMILAGSEQVSRGHVGSHRGATRLAPAPAACSHSQLVCKPHQQIAPTRGQRVALQPGAVSTAPVGALPARPLCELCSADNAERRDLEQFPPRRAFMLQFQAAVADGRQPPPRLTDPPLQSLPRAFPLQA